jgi:predicted MPP superfamily phosphohydrolase
MGNHILIYDYVFFVRNLMQLDLISDLHLERQTYFRELLPLLMLIKKNQKSTILGLLGDIGYPTQRLYMQFLKQMALLYQYVIVIPGNHEYWDENVSIENLDQIMTQMCDQINTSPSEFGRKGSKGKIIYLQKSFVVIDGYRLIGCTLWSHINFPNKLGTAQFDYQYVHKSQSLLVTCEDTNQLHNDHVQWIQSQITECHQNNQPLIVLTHFGPEVETRAIPPKFRGGNYQEGYSTELRTMIKPPIVCWCYGHTHHPYKGDHNGVLIQNNSIGGINYLRPDFAKHMLCLIRK